MIDVGAVIRQGALPHGPVLLGGGPRTIAQAGCLFCAGVMGARAMSPAQKQLTAIGAHTTLLAKHGTFLGSALIVHEAFLTLGMRLKARSVFDLATLADEIDQGRPVILGIDFVAGRSSGFSDADHFVTAVDVMQNGDIIFADPATGDFSKPFTPTRGVYRGKPATFSEMLTLEALPQ